MNCSLCYSSWIPDTWAEQLPTDAQLELVHVELGILVTRIPDEDPIPFMLTLKCDEPTAFER